MSRGTTSVRMRSHIYNRSISSMHSLCQRCDIMIGCWWPWWSSGMPPHHLSSFLLERWWSLWRMCIRFSNCPSVDDGWWSTTPGQHRSVWRMSSTTTPLLFWVTIDGRGSHLHEGLIHTVCEMVKYQTFFSWGCNMLEHLYQELGQYMHYEYHSLTTYTLLQVWDFPTLCVRIRLGSPRGDHTMSPWPIGMRWQGNGGMKIYSFGNYSLIPLCLIGSDGDPTIFSGG